MDSKVITPLINFIGRAAEQAYLHKLADTNEAAILIIYGRRRVGKTELLEQTYRNRHVLKFEGLENQPQSKQQKQVLYELSRYAKDTMLAKVESSHWRDVFEILARYVKDGEWTLYFEEVQWLANYQNDFIAELKWAWDNLFRHNPKLLLILCGSSPSFMINKVVKSKALYNRSQNELALQEFNLIEARQFLGPKRSASEILDAYLTLGGIPEYLKRIKGASSLFLGMCENAFKTNGFFTGEYERIFVSSLSTHNNYRQIVDYLSQHRFATREQILRHIGSASGGTPTQQLIDLEQCGFVTKYSPYHLAENSKLTRYTVSDGYLQFYFKFIKPLGKRVASGEFNTEPAKAINIDTYRKWLGYSFERFCRKYQHVIAKILGFNGVRYRAGPYFSRSTQSAKPGYQIDLLFDRDDKVITLCEIKYQNTPVAKSIVNEFEKKAALLANPKNKTIHRVLIAPTGCDKSLKSIAVFDAVITQNELFDVHYW